MSRASRYWRTPKPGIDPFDDGTPAAVGPTAVQWASQRRTRRRWGWLPLASFFVVPIALITQANNEEPGAGLAVAAVAVLVTFGAALWLSWKNDRCPACRRFATGGRGFGVQPIRYCPRCGAQLR